ncbi:MAG: uroporphyrinogen-III synthase [Chloroflexota bacterium]
MGVLDGRVVAVLEARRAGDMASLITRQGGTPYPAPALKEVPLENQSEVAEFVDKLATESCSVAIFLTGVGAEALLAAAGALGRLPEVLRTLARAIVVARGPKPVAVLKRYGVRVDLVPPEPNTSRELLAQLDPLDLRGRLVALQHYGQPNVFLRDALLAKGAQLLEVSLYGWEMPDDRGPLIAFLAEVQRGGVDAVAATSQAQVHNLFRLAGHFGQTEALRAALNQSVAVASVGPVCSRAWRELGVEVDIEPEHPKMGHLVLAIGAYLADPERAKRRDG